MKILLKNILIQDINSKHHQEVKDILIENGLIIKIDNGITTKADSILEKENISASIGFVDIFSKIGEPGFEYNETLITASNAAQAGGFTRIFSLPNTHPTVSTQSQINYIKEKSNSLPVFIHSLGAISKNIEGNTLAEMYDMFSNGAIAFSDGDTPIQSTVLMLKALQYVKAFNGIIVQMPLDKGFSKIGVMNEGIVSTTLGMPGIPELAETLMIKRDIELLKYAESKLHLTGVSTASGIELITEAKKHGLQITCSVAPHHLLFCDEDIVDYNTNFKVDPPLRTRKDMMALRMAVMNNEIDCIACHHVPVHNDFKDCEFDRAANGMIHLQTVFAEINTALPELSTTKLLALFSYHPRTIFNLPIPKIEEGEQAEITLFNKETEFTLTKENNKSKSYNSVLFNKNLKGEIIGTINKGKIFIN